MEPSLAHLLAAIDISLFGQEGHTGLNGSRGMRYSCQDELELVKGQFVNVCCSRHVHVLCACVCVQGVGFQDNIPEETLA